MDRLVENKKSPPVVGDLIQWSDDAVGLVVRIELQESLSGSINYFADDEKKSKLYWVHWQDKNETYPLPSTAFSRNASLRWTKLTK